MAERGRFVTRLVRESDIPAVARIRYDAFNNNPRNTTRDEMSAILALEIDPELQRIPTRAESIAQLERINRELLASGKVHVVGIYHLPAGSSSPPPPPLTLPEAQGEDRDASDLPPDSVLAGLAIWQYIDEHTPSDIPESNKKELEAPTLLNRFFAKMNRTREAAMQGKRYWFLKLLVIDPEFQRQGLGTILVKWGTARADKDGVHAWLESSPMGKGAYLKAGFKVLGLDRVDEPRAEKGYLEWPYMLHEPRTVA
ncbi:hypothetical protein EX895_005110 [Sporisorium graminicola]|uniref:N-acetyltransferase domain-containing protein n=1 Tax=Sporisorium graminicola TaxID=280036 RepID=A0A4U7KP72_9BASI|nr:hypothetical protein EX895_005110 [Sporisorium graminicola]TKY86285.1 hypothetical protein EX895_005110 [Sporisorium graminicola]